MPIFVDRDDIAERLRRVLEVAPGERPLTPRFGCRIHALGAFDALDEHGRRLSEALVEEALERWAPWAHVRRATVIDATASSLRIAIVGGCGHHELEISRHVDEDDGGDGDDDRRGDGGDE